MFCPWNYPVVYEFHCVLSTELSSSGLFSLNYPAVFIVLRIIYLCIISSELSGSVLSPWKIRHCKMSLHLFSKVYYPKKLSGAKGCPQNYLALRYIIEIIWHCIMSSHLSKTSKCHLNCDIISTKQHEICSRNYPALKFTLGIFVEVYVFELSDINYFYTSISQIMQHSKMASELSDTLSIKLIASIQ